MTVAQLYHQLKIPNNLQLHMLRVAGIAQFILDHWPKKISSDKERNLIFACLFHDVANIIKYDLRPGKLLSTSTKHDLALDICQNQDWSYQNQKSQKKPRKPSAEVYDFWRQEKQNFIKKFGFNEKKAIQTIFSHLKLNTETINLTLKHSFSQTKKVTQQEDSHQSWLNLDSDKLQLLLLYADLRVCPHKVCPVQERLENFKNRYKDRKKYALHYNTVREYQRLSLILDKKIMNFLDLKKGQINDHSIKKYLPQIAKSEIKQIRPF